MKPRINERCSSGLVNKIIGEVFDSELQALGFQKSTPRKYVRSRIQQTHDVIELLSQTIQLRFIWGISLQFVPHIEGRSTETVKWHRTVASANPDLRYSETENVPNGHVLYNVSTI